MMENKLLDLEASIEPRESYTRIGLKHNPFPGGGLAPDAPKIPPFPEVRDNIDHFLASFIRTKESRGMVILGDYGTGKTHHLRYIQRRLEALGRIHVKTVFLDSPGVEPYDLIRGVIEQIGETEVAKAVWTILAPRLRERIASEGQRLFHLFLRDKTVKEREQARRLKETALLDVPLVPIDEEVLSDHRRFLRAFDQSPLLSREKLRDYFARALLESGRDTQTFTSNAAIARHLTSICLYDGAPALESWERLTTRSTRLQLFPPEGEPQFLQAILRLLLANGYGYFVLLLDEFEKVPEMELMTKREARRYLDTVRMLIDRSWETLPFAYVIGSVDASWQRVEAELDRALADRFLTKIDLPRLDREEVAIYLITEHLKRAQLEEIAPESSLSPFPPNLLQLVPLDYRRTARQLLVLCYDLIELAVARNLSKISENLVSEYLAGKAMETGGDEGAGT